MLSQILTKEILSAIAVVITIVSYIPYVSDIYKGETRPHVFSWIIWGILTGITYAAQVVEGGGVGTWSMGLTFILCISVGIISIKKGEKNITKSDWACFAGALMAIPIWRITKEPLNAIVIVTLIDILSFYPTFRKTYIKPYSETLILYILAGIKFLLVTLSLENINLTTTLYPITVIWLNVGFVILILYRRKILATAKIAIHK